jgi:hypothetical protein
MTANMAHQFPAPEKFPHKRIRSASPAAIEPRARIIFPVLSSCFTSFHVDILAWKDVETARQV